MSTAIVIRFVLWVWLLAALAVGHYHLLQRQTLPAVQGILFAITAALILAYRRISAFRAWVNALDLRALVALHLSRFVGIYFLLLYRRGELPYAFAVPGGIGDIIVAAFALVIVVFPFEEPLRARLIYIWNVVGMIDILLVVLSAARIGFSGSDPMRPLTYLPLSLLPTFLVPLIIASHLAIFARLSASRAHPQVK